MQITNQLPVAIQHPLHGAAGGRGGWSPAGRNSGSPSPGQVSAASSGTGSMADTFASLVMQSWREPSGARSRTPINPSFITRAAVTACTGTRPSATQARIAGIRLARSRAQFSCAGLPSADLPPTGLPSAGLSSTGLSSLWEASSAPASSSARSAGPAVGSSTACTSPAGLQQPVARLPSGKEITARHGRSGVWSDMVEAQISRTMVATSTWSGASSGTPRKLWIGGSRKSSD
ncbi:hypothetical protein ACFQ4K_18215 [Tistrella bauzanensis]